MASEYLKWKYKDVQPEAKTELTPSQRRRNWWYYHKWWVAGGILLLLAVCTFAWGKVQDWQNRPDYQVAYVGTSYLDEDTAQGWEKTFAALAEDADGNGKTIVRLNQYVFPPDDPEGSASASVLLMSDLLDCESYFFLLEDPEGFQESYEVLQPGNGEALPWLDTELTLTRRGFWNEKTTANPEACGVLWEKLKEGTGK